MKRTRPRLGLLARIALALGAVGFVPLWLVSQQLLGINRTALEEQTKNNLSLAARTTAERIESFLQARAILAEATAADPALADPISDSAAAALRNHLLAGRSLGLLAAAVVDPDGGEILRAQLRGEGPRTDRALAAAGGDAVVVVGQGSVALVRLGVPLARRSLRMVYDAGGLLEILTETRELGGQAELVVATREGQTVLGSAAALAAFPPNLVEAALSGKLEAGARRDYSDPQGRRLAGAFALVPSPGWTVLSQQPLATAEAVASEMRRRSWLAVSAAAGLIVGLAALAYSTLVRPLRALAKAQRRLAGLPPVASSGDEVQALAASFRALERSVRDREDLGRVFLGRYQVVEIIGRGAMGTVFRGWDPKLQRPVALKTIRLDEKLDADRRRRLVANLISEAVTGARFSHPNILQVYDVEDLPEATFIATEFVDGMSLDYLLWLEERLDAARVVPLAAAVARGLGAAHRHGVVHRDVKPSNILLGKDGSIKVGDFGIARLVAASSSAHDEVFGTPGFMPPEALIGRPYEKSGDLFALGVMLYHALSGKFPFGGKTASELARRTVVGTLQPLLKLAPETPSELCSAVHRLLDKNPRKRDVDADVLADQFEELARLHGWRWSLPENAVARDGIYTAPTAARFVPTARLEPLAKAVVEEGGAD